MQASNMTQPPKYQPDWKKDNFFVPPAWMQLPNYLHDCYFYCYSKCLKTGSCPYRHEYSSLGVEQVCERWLSGSCWDLHCSQRHMCILPNRRSEKQCYWERRPPNGCMKPHCPFKHTQTEASADGGAQRQLPRAALCQEQQQQQQPLLAHAAPAPPLPVPTDRPAELVALPAVAAPSAPTQTDAAADSSGSNDTDAGIEADALCSSPASLAECTQSPPPPTADSSPVDASTPDDQRPATDRCLDDSGRHGSSDSEKSDDDDDDEAEADGGPDDGTDEETSSAQSGSEAGTARTSSASESDGSGSGSESESESSSSSSENRSD